MTRSTVRSVVQVVEDLVERSRAPGRRPAGPAPRTPGRRRSRPSASGAAPSDIESIRDRTRLWRLSGSSRSRSASASAGSTPWRRDEADQLLDVERVAAGAVQRRARRTHRGISLGVGVRRDLLELRAGSARRRRRRASSSRTISREVGDRLDPEPAAGLGGRPVGEDDQDRQRRRSPGPGPRAGRATAGRSSGSPRGRGRPAPRRTGPGGRSRAGPRARPCGASRRSRAVSVGVRRSRAPTTRREQRRALDELRVDRRERRLGAGRAWHRRRRRRPRARTGAARSRARRSSSCSCRTTGIRRTRRRGRAGGRSGRTPRSAATCPCRRRPRSRRSARRRRSSLASAASSVASSSRRPTRSSSIAGLAARRALERAGQGVGDDRRRLALHGEGRAAPPR